MKIPQRNLADWTRELIDECTVSRESRRAQYRMWKSIYYTGSNTGVPSKHNRCFSHVDKLSSFLFSPSDVRFNIEFEGDTDETWSERGEVGARYLNRMFSRRRCDVTFAEANEWSLVKGATFVKLVWGRGGFEPWVVQPEFMGVLREDIQDLDRQDAFVHSFYLTEAQFRRLLGDRHDRNEILARATQAFDANAMSAYEDGFRHDVTAGGGPGVPAILLPGQAGQQQQGNVDWTTAQQGPTLAPEVAARLIRVDDVWIMDDDRQDWTTIRYVDPGVVIEGELQRRNLSDVPHDHPFVKVCSNEVPNYFWGRSEIANVWQNQKLLTARVNNIDAIFNLIAKPPRAFKGYAGITDEKARLLLAPGGVFTDSSPTGEIKDLSPTMPQGALEYLSVLDGYFDEAAGFTPILQGQGEPGVRAGSHANTLLRTSSPRLRDRALVVEKQCAAFGELCLKMLQEKDARVLMPTTDKAFMLSQLPDDASVIVDSHTSSPAFSGDNKELAFALAKSSAIDGETLIEMTHPPREDVLIARMRKQQAQHAAQLEDLKKNFPDAYAKALLGGGRKR